MSNFDIGNRVAQSNDLILGLWKSESVITMKLFEMAVSCIDTSNPPLDRFIYVDKAAILDFFQIKDKSGSTYQRFQEHMERLRKQGIILHLPGNRIASVTAIPYIEWGTAENDQVVRMQFSEQIMPYVIELSTNFTQYYIAEIKNLNSKYSVILFKWLVMNFKRGHKIVSVSMNQLRTMTSTLEDYSDFRNFEKRVLKNAEEEINKSTDITIKYKKIKGSRNKIIAIEFHIRAKKSFRDTSFDYPIGIKQSDDFVIPGQLTIDDF